jgi:RNA polymerase sigma factor (sigma-70 family)
MSTSNVKTANPSTIIGNKKEIQIGLKTDGYPQTAKYIDGIIGLAKKLTIKYGQSAHLDDFIQEALITATKLEQTSWDSARSNSFYTYIVKPIKNQIQHVFGNRNRRHKKYKIIQKFIETYSTENLGRYPDVSTISNGTKLSHFEIMSIYYDKHNTIQLSALDDEFVATDNEDDESWILSYIQAIPAETHRVVLSLIYEDGLDIRTVATKQGISQTECLKIHDAGIEAVKKLLVKDGLL